MSGAASEALDAAAVHAWLGARVPDLGATLPEVTQYAGGASNWTYRLKYPTHDFVLRRPPAGTKAKSAHDMGREFRVQSALRPVYPYVPEMIAFCDDAAVLGCDFYVMKRIPGPIPRARMPKEITLDAAQTRALCLATIDKLVELHAVDVDATGLAQLGKGPGYAKRQIDGWTGRYAKARTWNVPRFTRVTAWLAAHTPADTAACLIHGDFRFDNVVLDERDPTRVVGVLDWEMSTIGCPLMDLGNSLAYWVQADDDWFGQKMRRQPTHLPGMLTRAEVVAYYAERSGRTVENWPFYEVYGLFRLAAILQQIYYRYHHGQTKNPAFRWFWAMVHYLHRRCLRAIREAS